jgi:hypothetical protein
METVKGILLYTADAVLAGANGAAKAIDVPAEGGQLSLVQCYIEADALTTSQVVLTLQGRLNASAAWVGIKKSDHSTAATFTQAASGALTELTMFVETMPEMRVVVSGTYAATAGNDLRVWILARGAATRSDS